MRRGQHFAALIAAALIVSGCSASGDDTPRPDAAASAPSDASTGSPTGPPTGSGEPTTSPTSTTSPGSTPQGGTEVSGAAAQLMLDEAMQAMRSADAVAVTVRSDYVYGGKDDVTNVRGVWSHLPAVWQLRTSIDLGTAATKNRDQYIAEQRYVDDTSYQRVRFGNTGWSGWGKSAGLPPVGFARSAFVPVSLLVDADAKGGSQWDGGGVIFASVPNGVADRWLGLERRLDERAYGGAMRGGQTTITITVDAEGFPVEVGYFGSAVEVNTELPDDLVQDFAASSVRFYYQATKLPDSVTMDPTSSG